MIVIYATKLLLLLGAAEISEIANISQISEIEEVRVLTPTINIALHYGMSSVYCIYLIYIK
jgi:hypothetical protein